ncbi:hypothetical protein FMEAI12_4580032 [Parafrankia sp. Ea1.12]|nr:hypothetical protein FMEAI12_4580032 [Parafrankia sp. Ea1.12]
MRRPGSWPASWLTSRRDFLKPRQAGTAYQFRHAELQRHQAERPRSAVPAHRSVTTEKERGYDSTAQPRG